MLSVPIVDISRPTATSLDALDAACRDHGFFLLSGHGLDDLINRTWQQTARFFDTDRAIKNEITRDIEIRFNHRFGETYIIPKAVTPTSGARVMDLQNPTSKMSKSGDDDSGVIYLLDVPAKIEKKFKRAVTDSGSEVIFDREKKPGVANLLEILSAATNSTPQETAKSYTRYGDLKTASADAVIAMLAPIQKRYNELLGDKAELMRLIHKGNDRAQAVASATLARAQKSIGFLSSK